MIWEWCPECDSEVQLEDVMKVQKCPECGADILPCTYCIDIYGGCATPCRITGE